MTVAPNYAREPWKHPAVWNGHLVKMTRDYPVGAGGRQIAVSVATCECGWCACAKIGGGGHVAQDDAVMDHWQSIIAEAESVPA